MQARVDRYQNETRRLFTVLDSRLKDNAFLAGDYSIAVRTYRWSGVSLEVFDHLRRWIDAISCTPGRPARHQGAEAPGSAAYREGKAKGVDKTVEAARSTVHR
jgi:GST-like protein